MSSYIPAAPSVSFWDASPRFRELCKRKLGEAYIRGEQALAEMGRRAAFEVAPLGDDESLAALQLRRRRRGHGARDS
jgi:hypothetical protein